MAEIDDRLRDLLESPGASRIQDAGVRINTDHGSSGTHELGGDHRHCSDITADIQHFHAWAEPGLMEKPARAVGVRLSLPNEPLGFDFRG